MNKTTKSLDERIKEVKAIADFINSQRKGINIRTNESNETNESNKPISSKYGLNED